MAWNVSNSSVDRRQSSIQKKNLLGYALLSGIFFVAIGFILFFVAKDNEEDVVVKKHGPIKEISPDVAVQQTLECQALKSKPVDPDARPTQSGQVVNGYVLTGSGRMHKIRGAITNTIGLVKADYEIFDHFCENEIACLLSLNPGDTIVGDPPYRGRLIDDFINSLKHPIIVKDDDSEHDKALKRAVIATKIDLKEAMDRGENIETILLEARAECRRLAEYKRFLQLEVRQKVKDGELSSEDFRDYVDAANLMLEEKGIAPLKLSPIMKRKLILDANKETYE